MAVMEIAVVIKYAGTTSKMYHQLEIITETGSFMEQLCLWYFTYLETSFNFLFVYNYDREQHCYPTIHPELHIQITI